MNKKDSNIVDLNEGRKRIAKKKQAASKDQSASKARPWTVYLQLAFFLGVIAFTMYLCGGQKG